MMVFLCVPKKIPEEKKIKRYYLIITQIIIILILITQIILILIIMNQIIMAIIIIMIIMIRFMKMSLLHSFKIYLNF